MAAGNKVVLTFAGDSSALEKSMDRVGSGAEGMGRKVGDAGDRFDRVGESADTMDTRAMGMRDTFTGVQDTWQGLTKEGATMQERMLLLGMGMGDLASGVANFGVQFAKQAANFVTNGAKMVASHAVNVAKIVAGWVLMGVQATINAVKMAAAWLISLGPVALVILAVGAVIGILVALGVGFDDVANVASAAWGLILGAAQGVWNWLTANWPLVLAILTGPIGLAVLAIVKHKDTIIGAFRAAFDWIKGAATGTKDWIVARFNDVVEFFKGLPGKIGGFFSGLGESIVGGIKSIWNNTVGGFGFTFGGWNPPGPGSIPGFSFRIPELHQGGMFEAPPGQREGLAMLLDGERVTRPGAAAPNVTIIVQGSLIGTEDVKQVVRDQIVRGGWAA